MALRPPRHRIDADMVFVSGLDSCWDWERIKRESEDLDDEDPHPYAYYIAGLSRYDVTAELELGDERVAISDYWTETPQAKFHLRTLEPSKMGDVVATLRGASIIEERDPVACEKAKHQAYYMACKYGLAKVEGAFSVSPAPGGGLPETDMQKLMDAGGYDLISDIGQAVFRASQKLSLAEKKA